MRTLALVLSAGALLLSTPAAARPGQGRDLEPPDRTPRRLLSVPSPCPGPTCTAPPPASPNAKGLRVVYLNFDGVTLTRSPTDDNAVTGKSAIVKQSMTIPPFNPADLAYTGGLSRSQIISRVVEQMYASHAPYDVEFVTERPAEGPYSMVVFGGSCQSVVGESNCAGIALRDCGDYLPNNITFAFPLGLHVDDLAATAAQEEAHAFGLAHTDDTTDIMYPYLQPNYTPTSFGAGEVPDQSACPGVLYQDSHATMLQVIGPRGQDVTGPTITITAPAPGATIAIGSPVAAEVTDASSITRVSLAINAAMVAERTSPPWTFEIPEGTAPGEVDILLRAYDGEGNTSSERVKAYLPSGDEEPCGPGGTCSDGLECQDGLCVPGDGIGGLGASCTMNEECESGICAESEGEQRCSQQCSEAAPCPDGFECKAGIACWPVEETEGGGCSATGSARVSLLGLLWLAWLGAAFVILRRRRV